MISRLVPELDVDNLDTSLAFYVDLVGCEILFSRPEEKFAFLDLQGSQIMLEEAAGPGRRFRTAPLEKPFGRGINFMIQVDDIEGLHDRIFNSSQEIVIPLEDRWYRENDIEHGHRQFVVADPDGYLLRFHEYLGTRKVQELGRISLERNVG